jgi:hypothetical protein
MQAIRSPADLPGTKVRLASLFIEIGEEQEQEQRNNAGNDGNNVRDKDERETVHVALIERQMTKRKKQQTSCLQWFHTMEANTIV